jgi:hypothetical protein
MRVFPDSKTQNNFAGVEKNLKSGDFRILSRQN